MEGFKDLSPPWCRLESASKDARTWVVQVLGPEGSLYAGEHFHLKVQLPINYPQKPPSAYFVRLPLPKNETISGDGSINKRTIYSSIPRHPHIYSNGDICLSVLGKDWRSSMTVESVIVSIVSLLSSSKSKRLPPDNTLHSENNIPGQQQVNWMYHDNAC